jgi:hypothetical protein
MIKKYCLVLIGVPIHIDYCFNFTLGSEKRKKQHYIWPEDQLLTKLMKRVKETQTGRLKK